jgi:hypothetical protein
VVRWDGRDENGTLLSSGVYFGRLRAGRDMRATKLVFVK